MSQCSSTNGQLTLAVNFGNGEQSVQIRPWCKTHKVWKAEWVDSSAINYRYSVFLGGVPRTTTAGTDLVYC